MQSIGAQQAKVPHGLSVLEKLGYSEGIHVIRTMSTEFFSTRSDQPLCKELVARSSVFVFFTLVLCA